MLTYKIKPGNTKMLYWLPGRNDLFMHYAAAEALLDAGYDVFVMEHRRLGRANSDSTFRDFQLISHTTDLKIYMDEFEKGLAFARDLNPTYQRAILYAHSTGGLEASVWLRERGPELNFAAVVLNSPFLAWGNEGLADKALDRMGGYVMYPIVKCVFGGDTGPMLGPDAQSRDAVTDRLSNLGLHQNLQISCPRVSSPRALRVRWRLPLDAAPCGRPEAAQRVGHRLDGDGRLGARVHACAERTQQVAARHDAAHAAPHDAGRQRPPD